VSPVFVSCSIHITNFESTSENQPSSAVATEVKIKTESNSLLTTVKFEDEDMKKEDGTDSM
jgi:hypothetical protein